MHLTCFGSSITATPSHTHTHSRRQRPGGSASRGHLPRVNAPRKSEMFVCRKSQPMPATYTRQKHRCYKSRTIMLEWLLLKYNIYKKSFLYVDPKYSLGDTTPTPKNTTPRTAHNLATNGEALHSLVTPSLPFLSFPFLFLSSSLTSGVIFPCQATPLTGAEAMSASTSRTAASTWVLLPWM